MKMGFRTPSVSKSLSARTSGRAKRMVKSANPVYGKKMTGAIRDPKRALYNSAYHKTTVGVSDIAAGGSDVEPQAGGSPPDAPTPHPKKPFYKNPWFWLIVIFAVAIGASVSQDKKDETVAEATPSPTASEEPTPSPTSEPTATPDPEDTPEPTKKPKTYVYVAASGSGECYHTSKTCSRMRGNVKKLTLKKAKKKKYRPCSICAKGVVE